MKIHGKYLALTFCMFSIIFFDSCKHRAIENSRSMLPTLDIGDVVEFTKSDKSLTYGDIIIIDFELSEPPYISIREPGAFRVVGLSGDSIAVDNNICVINGRKNNFKKIREVEFNDEYESANEYEESFPNGIKIRIYSNHDIPNIIKTVHDMTTIKVPNNHYFLMGDYRSNSVDSRTVGTISMDKIIGKITKIHKSNE